MTESTLNLPEQATEPCSHVRRLQATAQALRHTLQELVANRMAKGIVDAFELVNVEIEYRELFARPRHPYTAGLLRSVPSMQSGGGRKLHEIPGMVPPLDALPPGCRFQDRCPRVQERCRKEAPELQPDTIAPERLVRCFFPVPWDDPKEAAA